MSTFQKSYVATLRFYGFAALTAIFAIGIASVSADTCEPGLTCTTVAPSPTH